MLSYEEAIKQLESMKPIEVKDGVDRHVTKLYSQSQIEILLKVIYGLAPEDIFREEE